MPPNEWVSEFEIVQNCKKSKARAGILKLSHGKVDTPVFMPVGTYGTIKGLLPEDLIAMDYQIILGNTYHLGKKSTLDVISKCGGLHKFMNWNRNILTDSGGFQIVSLSDLVTITEAGVMFKNGSEEIMLTPEESIGIQMKLGSDIMMQLDDVVPSTTTGDRVNEAMLRSVNWLDRCLEIIPFETKQNLFPIIQGGLDINLRHDCIQKMTERNVPGFAIGGLSGGEEKAKFCKVVDFCTDKLPPNKPRYLMGVGYTLDLVVCTALGCDMYDCVFPTRTARFGSALTYYGSLDLKNAQYLIDIDPIDRKCVCYACQNYTRSHIHHLLMSNCTVGAQLVTIHNLYFQKHLMSSMRNAILGDTFDVWVKEFIRNYTQTSKVPEWVENALKTVNIVLD